MALKTNYKNDVLKTSVNNERTYNLVDANGDIVYEGIKLRETTQFSTVGDSYGATQINEQNTKINSHDTAITQLNADLTDIREEIQNMSALPSLDFANPLYTFDSTHLSYTATKDCYLYGNIGTSGGAVQNGTVTIDGTLVFKATWNASDCIALLPITKIKSGSTVTLNTSAGGNNCALKVYDVAS
jgi:hypothetical protein